MPPQSPRPNRSSIVMGLAPISFQFRPAGSLTLKCVGWSETVPFFPQPARSWQDTMTIQIQVQDRKYSCLGGESKAGVSKDGLQPKLLLLAACIENRYFGLVWLRK